MRILLATAVAIAPLMAASGAMAEVVISTVRTTPIATSNATGTGPDDIRIASGGAVNVASGAAVTIDVSENFTLDSGGGINMTPAADGATGLLVNPGVTSNVTINGSIALIDTIDTYPDTDSDGDIDGPWATGSGRYGVRYAAGAPVTGDLVVGSTGVISVDGNNSYGISIESGLSGKLQTQGTIRVFGDNSVAIRTQGPINGPVTLLGTISARGANTSAISIGGDVGGRVSLQGEISASGYRYTTLGNDTFEGKLDADDKLQGGAAVIIAGNVAGGVIVDRAPVDADTANADEDGDGIPDVNETQGTINSYGAAPAIQVGSVTRSITLGAVGTGDNQFGFINRGTVNGQGVYAGVDANAIVFGGNPGQTVTITGGVRNEGTVAALASDANATAIRLGTGTTAPQIFNSGAITGGVASELASATATAIRIDAGASVSSFVNNGSILASAGGGTATVTGVLDLSGSLTSINNTRSIQATLNPNAAGDPLTGTTTAIDVSANTTGVTLIQTGVAATATAANPDTDGDGVPDGNEPIIAGAIKLGSGADTVDIRNGLVLGDIAFGAGADRLSISGGGVVRGALADAGGDLAIDVSNGTLDARQVTRTNITSLNVGADGDLIVTIDPANSTAGGFNVAGTATLANGAGLGVRFTSLLAAPNRFTLIDAATLNFGAIDLDSIESNSPYLYVVEAGANVPAGEVFVDVRQRTAAEAELIPVEAAFYDAFYAAIGDADALSIRNAFLAQAGREEFINLYEQLLPDHSGGPLVSLASGVDAVTRALTGRNASAAPGETSAWVQEINFYADKDKTDTYGFRSEGFGVAGGIERGSGLGNIGISAAFTSSDLEDPEAEAEEVLSANLLELGLYWRAQGQYWTTWARAAAGYATFNSERRFVGAGLNLSNESDWNGFTLAAAGGASYERSYGRFSIRPEIYAEYFSLSEDGHVEEGGGDGFDLEIDDREGHLFSATAAVNLGMGMGENSWLRPELRVGWRQNISVDPGETIARFRSGGPDFTLAGGSIEGGGPIVGFRLNVGNELGMLSISADAEMIEDYVRYMLFLRASFRF
ncbi:MULTISPECIES: autotransporter outer membrane beta-barrel domain-containing protein [unclassified Brevundimonas]|uniref:autotransporter outer membrane beta-barrel domain-containing protein n=1 Tax=unclassified Brevundimonas TaxID=2622653 RepID=UPI0006F1FDF0|nr:MULTISPECIES: autotransporter outer membrane beta-barrel domain-containing protein [unclassified Brevundimonas]KQY93098.1 autotransporter subunit beta [Brevundimonas sp. Root1423]KRA27132.1 autotransporter subunit beta [Brevundimonas sp. Root608]